MIELAPLQIRAIGHLGPSWSFWVVAIVSAGLLAMAVVARVLAARFQRRVEQTAALANAPPDLARGWAVFSGEIEDDEVDAPAVQVDITQRRASNWRGVFWRETSRTVRARPFALRLDDGRRIRVEPGERVFAVAGLNVNRAVRADERQRSAVVRAGKRVCVTGVLGKGFDPAQAGAGYRDLGQGLVLSPPPRESMLVSTESIDTLVSNQRERVAMHRRFARFPLVLLVMSHALMFWRFDALLFAGRTVRARINGGRSAMVQRSAASTTWVRHYYLQAVYDDARSHRRTVESEVDYRDFFPARFAAAPRVYWLVVPAYDPDQWGRQQFDLDQPIERDVWWREVPGTGIAEIGGEASAHGVALAGFALLGALLALVYARSGAAARPWYERQRIVDRDEARR